MTIRRTSLCLSMLLLLVLCFALLPAQALAAGDFDTPRELEVLSESPAPVFRSSGEITVYFRDVLNWGSPYVYYWDDGGDGPQWPGVAMTYSINNYGESVYWAKIPAGITGIIFHTNVFRTVDIFTDIVDGAMWYPTEQKDDEGHNYVEYFEPSQQPSEEPSEQPTEQPTEPLTEQPTQQPSEEPQTEAYYLVGTMNEWQRDNAYRLSYRTDGEYAIYDVELARYDEIKILSDSWTWYPDGADNNYVITADGTYDVHFRPNGDGGEGWYEGCIYVVASEEPGEEPTQQPTQQPTEEPQTEAYYLVGSMNGWSADNAYKLTRLDESEDDEYILRNVQLTTDDSFKIA